MNPRQSEALLTIQQVSRLVCISRANLYLLMKKGLFPVPYRISPRLIRWKIQDITNYLDNLPKASHLENKNE